CFWVASVVTSATCGDSLVAFAIPLAGASRSRARASTYRRRLVARSKHHAVGGEPILLAGELPEHCDNAVKQSRCRSGFFSAQVAPSAGYSKRGSSFVSVAGGGEEPA